MFLAGAIQTCLLASLAMGAPTLETQEDSEMETLPASLPDFGRPAGNTRPWGGPAGNTRPWGGPAINTLPWGRQAGNIMPWGGPSLNTRPWVGPSIKTGPWGGPSLNTRPWGGPSMNTRPWGSPSMKSLPWRQPYMEQMQQPQISDPASVSTNNIEILPAFPQQEAMPGLLPQVQPATLPYQTMNQPTQASSWSKSYSPLPGKGNCFNKCGNRCGSYNTYSGCRPTCTTKCNIKPSCPSLSGGNNGYQYSGNTLVCGGSSNTQQGFNPGYGQSQGYNPGYGQGQGFNPGYGQDQGFNPGYGQEYNPTYGSYPMKPSGGCSTGGCSTSGFQTLPALTGNGMQTSGCGLGVSGSTSGGCSSGSSGYQTLPAAAGCSSGGCSSSSSGYQTLPAQLGYERQIAGDYMPANTLPAPISGEEKADEEDE